MKLLIKNFFTIVFISLIISSNMISLTNSIKTFKTKSPEEDKKDEELKQQCNSMKFSKTNFLVFLRSAFYVIRSNTFDIIYVHVADNPPNADEEKYLSQYEVIDDTILTDDHSDYLDEELKHVTIDNFEKFGIDQERRKKIAKALETNNKKKICQEYNKHKTEQLEKQEENLEYLDIYLRILVKIQKKYDVMIKDPNISYQTIYHKFIKKLKKQSESGFLSYLKCVFSRKKSIAATNIISMYNTYFNECAIVNNRQSCEFTQNEYDEKIAKPCFVGAIERMIEWYTESYESSFNEIEEIQKINIPKEVCPILDQVQCKTGIIDSVKQVISAITGVNSKNEVENIFTKIGKDFLIRVVEEIVALLSGGIYLIVKIFMKVVFFFVFLYKALKLKIEKFDYNEEKFLFNKALLWGKTIGILINIVVNDVLQLELLK